MKPKLDLHAIHSSGAEIDRALRAIIDEAVAKRAPLVEIIPERVLVPSRSMSCVSCGRRKIKALYHGVETDSDNFGRVFVHFRWK